jgi:secreted PhoX family phosphatase
MSWEGIAITPEGVLVGGDELRPGTTTSPTIGGPDSDGGAIFKFVPTTPRTTTGPITDLAQSPFVAGTVYALRVTCQANNPRSFGQGCEKGNAVWVRVNALTARADADRSGATGYYRPEDLEQDPNVDGLRVCFTNTGDRSALNFGEVLCAMDNDPLFATTTFVADAFSGSMVTSRAPVDVQVFLDGDNMLNQPDNIEFQAPTGNVYVIEDNANGDVYACLPDGDDRNLSTDGCVLILSVKDQTAEPTGYKFTGRGDQAFVFIQHSADDNDPMARNNDCPAPGVIAEFRSDDYCTDDLIRITGFRLPRKR